MQEPEQNNRPEEPAQTDPFVYEEFDISKFDFSIADPGEDPAPPAEEPQAPTPEPEPPEPEIAVPAEEPEIPAPQAQKGAFSAEEELLDEPPVLPRNKEKRPKEPQADPTANHPSIDRKILIRKAKRYLRYALRPSGLYENISESLWGIFLAGCCLFGCVFYLLIGLDWASAGLITPNRVWLLMLTGFLLGGTVSLAFAGGAALLAKLCKEDRLHPFRMLSAVAGAAVYPGVVLCLGLLLGLFGLSVSMSFGIVALLWWIFNLMEVLKDLLGNRFFPVVTFILLWGMGLFTLISATLMLK